MFGMTTSPLSSALAIGASGLTANQARLEVAAHNIANVQTPNFRRQELVAAERAQGGVELRIREQDALQNRQDDTRREEQRAGQNRLEQDLVDQHVALYQFQANVLTIKTQGTVLGSLLDMSA